MTSQDYELIASILASDLNSGKACGYRDVQEYVRKDLALRFAAQLSSRNTRFDVERFIRACRAE